jgi:hypothetical protein
MRRRRRFLVHLLCMRDVNGAVTQFVARIHPWSSRVNQNPEAMERVFADECEFIETVNSVLPRGSDVRNIFSHVETAEGFYYLLQLGEDEALRLGWSVKESRETP